MTEPDSPVSPPKQPLILWLGIFVIGTIVGASAMSVFQKGQTPAPVEQAKAPIPAKPKVERKQTKVQPKPVQVVKKPEPKKPAKVDVAKAKPVPAKKQVIAKKAEPTPAPKEPPAFDGFIIKGALSTEGEPWSSDSLIVKILWIKNQNDDVKLGHETARLKQDENGMFYELQLRDQPKQYTNWNSGVEGNIGRIIAWLDLERDGKLSIKKDRIIAVSKELIRYRTGRFDLERLNEVQQTNIRNEGPGYVVVKQVQLENQKADWQVAYRTSPAPINLSVLETQLPKLYTTMIKLQVK